MGTGSPQGHPRLGRRLGGRAFITFGYHRRPPARTRAGLRGPAPGLKGYRPRRRPLFDFSWEFGLVGTHPKQQNPSRIQAQRVATWSAEPVPFSTFEPAKSKGGWVGLEALAGIGWVDVTPLGSIVRHQPVQRHVTAASPAGEHACETAEPQQDSGPTGCHLVGRAGAV